MGSGENFILTQRCEPLMKLFSIFVFIVYIIVDLNNSNTIIAS